MGGKNERRQREQKKIKIVEKFQTPDTAAIIFAVTNAFPDIWKNRQNNDVTTNGKDIITGFKIEIIQPKQ